MMRLFEKYKGWYRKIPDKKRYIEFMTAALSVPVLITVLMTNIGNLKSKPETPPASPTPLVITLQPENPTIPLTQPQASSTPSVLQSDCIKEVGDIEIVHPAENEVIVEEPLAIDLDYQIGTYCAVVWSYRLNGGKWSDFTDKAIELYGIASGEKTLDVRIKSVVSTDSLTLSRKFTVDIPQDSPVATESAKQQ